MPKPSRTCAATVVARLSSDAATARKVADALAESLAADQFAASAFEDASGRWSLAIYFRDPPDAAAVRTLIASLAGAPAARALRFETLAPADWVRNSLEGLGPVVDAVDAKVPDDLRPLVMAKPMGTSDWRREQQLLQLAKELFK